MQSEMYAESPAREGGAEEGEEAQQQQQEQLASAYALYLTPVPKQKGDAGIYAAMDAMQLSRALHGVTDSRLDQSQQQHHQLLGSTLTAAGSGVAGARVNGANGGGPGSTSSSSSGAVQLGVEPEVFRHGASAAVNAILTAAVVEAVQPASGDVFMSANDVRAAVQRGLEGGPSGTSSTAVGLPDDVEALQRVLPLVHEVKPRDSVNYDALQRLFHLMESSAAGGAGITTLLLSKGVMDPARQSAPSTAAWEAVYNELQARYPLPSAANTTARGDEDVDEDEDSGEGAEGDRQHNAALQERCAKLNLPYQNYKQALRDVASYEMRVFPLLCAYLSHNEECRERTVAPDVDGGAHTTAHAAVRHRACANVKVLNLSSNRFGAAVVPAEAEGGAPVRYLAPLRALAAMIDANESLRFLNLRDNALGPRGVGIIAKALTKNIALAGIDLSANNVSGAAVAGADGGGEVEDVEDPLFEEEDAAFGEPLEGLDALAEVLKKNKFLRVLRLAENGLHSGEDLTGPPPADEEGQEGEGVEEDEGADATSGDGAGSRRAPKGLSMAAAQERWQGVPLWTLLTPLHRYHRLRVLDLSKNLLGNTGAQMVAVAVAHNHSIEVLDLTDNAIGYSGLGFLARYILAGSSPASSSDTPHHASALHTLILRQNPLACVGGAADAASGVDARRRRLTKRQQRQAARAMESFAAGLQRHGHLRRLIIANTYLGPAASAVVLRALTEVPTLEELDFSFNNACGDHTSTFDPAALPHIAALLYPPSSSSLQNPSSGQPRPSSVLQRLCLDGNNLTSAGLMALQPAVPGTRATSSLRELSLSRNSLGDALEPLAGVLAARLTRLDLSYNDITTMAALIRELPLVPALTDLNLSHNKLGVQEGLLRELTPARQETEVRDFFLALAQMAQLAVVDLSYNDWRPTHVEELGAIFADPSLARSLRKLDVRHTPRVPAGPLITLFQSIACRPTMEVFHASIPVERQGLTAANNAVERTKKKEEEEEEVREAAAVITYDGAVEVIHEVVSASASLVDVDCGLRMGDGKRLGRDDEASEATQERVAQIRERLLLNALMAASQPAPEVY